MHYLMLIPPRNGERGSAVAIQIRQSTITDHKSTQAHLPAPISLHRRLPHTLTYHLHHPQFIPRPQKPPPPPPPPPPNHKLPIPLPAHPHRHQEYLVPSSPTPNSAASSGPVKAKMPHSRVPWVATAERWMDSDCVMGSMRPL
jgi:hypothetical protein